MRRDARAGGVGGAGHRRCGAGPGAANQRPGDAHYLLRLPSGLRLTVWSDAPLARRRFHAYHYLGDDVEPNCTEGDMRP